MKFFGFLLFSRGDALFRDPEIEQINCSAGTHLYKGSCILDNPCPSDECWTYDASSGACLPQENEESSCSMLICSSDAMFVKFSSDLFGITSESDAFADVQNGPVWNEENENWEFSCILGECGMEFSQANKQLKWAISFSLPKKEVPVINTKINTELMTSITYECIYPKILTLTSDSYEVANVIEMPAAFQSYGSMASDLSMTLYADEYFTVESSSRHLGEPLWVEINRGSSRIQNLKFFVHTCRVKQAEASIEIVKNNCYARAVDAEFLSGFSHLVEHSSKWKFSTFTSKFDKESSQTVECDLVFCHNSFDCEYDPTNDNCPRETEDQKAFGFTLFGH